MSYGNCHLTAPQAKVDKLRGFEVALHLEGDTYQAAHQTAATFAGERGAT